jgi:hypothetical protein
MKKTALILLSIGLLVSSSYATKLKKIEENGSYIRQETSQNNVSDEANKPEPVKKLKLKKYKVRYDRGLEGYSVIPHDKNGFKKYMGDNEIEKFTLKRIFGTADSLISIAVSAYGYDWVYHRPDLAENFYLRLLEAPKLSLVEKIKIADYYLRTGRPEDISTVIKKTDCMASFKNAGNCFYYLGIREYLLTGNKRNMYLRLSKDKVKQAKKLYYSK